MWPKSEATLRGILSDFVIILKSDLDVQQKKVWIDLFQEMEPSNTSKAIIGKPPL
jgi:hypothetical protein